MSRIVIGTGLAVAMLSFVAPAMADSLFFDKVAVKTASEATCLGFASDTARGLGFRNVHKSGSEVAGEKDGAYIAITCVGRGGQPAIAVVMSVAPDFNVAKQAGQAVANKIKGIQNID